MRHALHLPALLLLTATALAAGAADLEESPSRLSDEAVPVRAELDPGRTPPLIEWGDHHLGPGALPAGIELPTGAVWQPALFVYGSYRTAIQAYDNGNRHLSEWVHRLDLTANLRLTGTERLVASLRPLDREGRFTGHYFHPDGDDGWHEELDGELEAFYFEGMFDELFPNLDRDDRRAHDVGFTLGRQPLFFQEGMLINDTIDAVGLVKSSIPLPGTANTRISLVHGWNQLHRNDNREDDGARITGLFTEFDLPYGTIDLDLAYVDSERAAGDGWFAGVSSVQRIGGFNTALRLLGSRATTDGAAVSSGTLLFGELSWTPKGTVDVAYLNAFVGVDEFSSAARAPGTGGALGRAGILFASPGMGRYGAALSNRPDNAWGGAVGYQRFIGGVRRQLVVEAGTRQGEGDDDAWALGARLQQALGKRLLVQLDAFAGDHDRNGEGWGLRGELQVKF